MAAMLTTKEVQDLINVDRSTIYRMAEAGKLPAVKGGRQWRFPASEIESWLRATTGPPPPSGHLAELLPEAPAAALADLVADIFGVMVLVTDLEGRAVLEPSHPCGLFEAVHESLAAYPRCEEAWRELAADTDRTPHLRTTPLGFMCARTFIRVGGQEIGMVIAGGIAPSEWPPPPDEIAVMARDLGLASDVLADHIDEVFYLDRSHQTWMLGYLPRIGQLFSRIAREPQRSEL